ncbi:hypothetical protein [Enterococcus gilvus]|uniref:Uncharacterized protein n=1 Tax=Enterococcus gilvus ATCC BAA-350 TaxID=1158614 RepID=R2VLT5_9ENTE|nr:hypothetical protein [Enterococcus gilvus]EOI58835.1 hypothetical protein UKC_00020 [Enterococcus gilvus ATCC BAA-350]EOW79288.1 hypothetical protein I592_03427 [Enterococcus gilvus ATCC BAA-350]OJG40513.1 hypothetical protein RV02_GL002014 [Enterococcus gilvus]
MLKSLEFWNFVIALLALVAAIYAIIYTHLQNKVEIDIVDGFYDRRKNDPFLLGFTVQNLSSSTLRLIELNITDLSNKPLNLISDFEPTQTFTTINNGYGINETKIPDIIGQYWYANPFENYVNLQPNSETYFSYYVNPITPKIKVNLTISRSGIFKKDQNIELLMSLKKMN